MKKETTELKNQDGENTGLLLAKKPEVPYYEPPTPEELAERQEAFKEMENIKADNAQSVTSKYWEARKGDEIRGIFVGTRMLFKNEGDQQKELPAIVIDTKDGEYLCSQLQILDTFINGRRIAPKSWVYLKCTHDKSQEMKEFEIKVLKKPEPAKESKAK